MLTDGAEERVCSLLEALGFSLWHPALEQKNANGDWEIMQGLTEFQEHLGGELTITLLNGIGVGEEVHVMHADHILQSIQWLKQRNTAGSQPVQHQ